jgi:hypothetical protein
MELRQILSFLSIAKTLHFGRTAKMIHLSQPALSLQIRAPEDEIGGTQNGTHRPVQRAHPLPLHVRPRGDFPR